MMPTIIAVYNREKKWILSLSLSVFLLFFLLPLKGSEMEFSSVFMAGLMQRLSSISFWLKAVVSSLGVGLLSILFLLFVQQLGKLLDRPSSRSEVPKK